MPALILRAFLPRGINLEFRLLTPLLFASGDLLGRWHNRRWRRDRVTTSARLAVIWIEKPLRSLSGAIYGHRLSYFRLDHKP
jgi:hypothetical protein